MIKKLERLTAALAEANRRLKAEITRRKSAEKSLLDSERHYRQLLDKSQHLQEQLRFLTRQLLLA